MRKVLSLAAVLSAAAVAASGCANLDSARTSTISEACHNAIQEQNEAWSDTGTAESALREAEIKGLNACKDLDEWSTAVSYNPGAMGYAELSTEEAANSVYLSCASNDPQQQSPVCADAAKRGYLDAS